MRRRNDMERKTLDSVSNFSDIELFPHLGEKTCKIWLMIMDRNRGTRFYGSTTKSISTK